MMRIRAQPIRAFLEVHGRLPGHLAHVVRVADIQQHYCLAEISEQRQLAIGSERRIVRRADAAEMLDISLLLGPVKTQYTRAADQAVEVRAIQCEIDTKALVIHSISFYVLKISRGIR